MSGQALSSDICGPISPASRQGNRYILTVVDTHSRFLIVEFLPTRQATPHRLYGILEYISHNSNTHPQSLHTENAKKYLSRESRHVYTKHGTSHTTTTPHTPQENSFAKRINSIIMNATRAALLHSSLHITHWEDAVRDAVFKYNHILHSSTGSLPTTLWHGPTPTVPKYLLFGQLGTIPHLANRFTIPKLHSRAPTVRYLYATYPKHVVVLALKTNKTMRIRSTNLHEYHRTSGPLATTRAAFKAFTPHRTPTTVTTTTPPLLHPEQAR